MERPVGILYEHPLWFGPLFTELERRGIPYEAVHAASHSFDPSEPESPYSLLVNRMSPSAWTRGHARALFQVREYLAYLDAIGAPVLNGSRAYEFELSKARQAALAAQLGVRYPRTRVINDPEQAPLPPRFGLTSTGNRIPSAAAGACAGSFITRVRG